LVISAKDSKGRFIRGLRLDWIAWNDGETKWGRAEIMAGCHYRLAILSSRQTKENAIKRNAL